MLISHYFAGQPPVAALSTNYAKDHITSPKQIQIGKI
jgi:hypothetical protein